MKDRDKLILQYGKTLLAYENHIKGTPGNIVTEAIVTHHYQNDPVFNRVIGIFLSIQDDGVIDYIEEPISVEENIQVLDEQSISFLYNETSKVVLIREGRNSIDFYPTTGKWKDNNDHQKVSHGNARKLIQYMDF